MDQLPTYLKIIFLSLHNSINEMAYGVLMEQGVHIIKYLKKAVSCFIFYITWVFTKFYVFN